MIFQRIAEFLAKTFDGVPWAIFWLVLLALMISIALIVTIVNGAKNASPRAPDPDTVATNPSRFLSLFKKREKLLTEISQSFRKTMDFLSRAFGGHDFAYRLPWFLLIGHEDSGKSTLMEQKHFSFGAFGGRESECHWWFLRRGIILDIRGDLFLEAKGVEAAEETWRSLLLLLCKHRPKRPLNGVILTVSVAELYEEESFAERVRFVAQKLLAMQDTLGMCVPVYVVVTKMDLIPGFTSFCAETPLENQQNILGWSNPYSLSVHYSARWVEEAFQSLSASLQKIQLDMLSHHHIDKTRDGVFMFTHGLEGLQKSLSLYLNAIFQNSSYEETPLLRGIYFVGDGGEGKENVKLTALPDHGEEGETKENALVLYKAHKIFFIEDLLEKKVLCEVGLIRPLKRRLSRVRKSLLVAKTVTFVLVGCGVSGAFVAYDRFQHICKELMPLFLRINKDLKTSLNAQKPDPDSFARYSKDLLYTLAKIEQSSFVSLFIPASWFSPVRKEMFSVLKQSYQETILKAIYMDLLLKIRTLLQNDILKHESTFHLDPLQTPHFQDLSQFVEELETLDLAVKKFNQLKTTANLADLGDLLKYTFGASLPVDSWAQQAQLIGFLRSMPFPRIDLIPYTGLAQDKCIKLYKAFLEGSLKYCFADQIYQFFKWINVQDLENIKKFNMVLTRHPVLEAGNTWIDFDYFSPGKAYSDLLTKIETLYLLGKPLLTTLLTMGTKEFKKFQKTMKAINRQIYPPNSPEQHALSEGLSDIQKSLKTLFQEPYMSIPTPYAFQSKPPPQHVVSWDTYLIQTACNTVEHFKSFMERQTVSVPYILKNHFRTFAVDGLKAYIQSLLGRAQTFVPIEQDNESLEAEETLRAQIRDFREGAPQFFKLLDVLSQGPLSHPFVGLRELLASNALMLLQKIDFLFENLSAYQTSSFELWTGEKGLALTAFSVHDEEDLTRYLELNRTQIVHLSLEYAKPLVHFLTHRSMLDFEGSRELLNKWYRIVEQVELYQKKAPSSSLTKLEKFATQDLNTYTVDSALEHIRHVQVESGDFFLERMRRIKKAVLERARFLRREKSIKEYEELAGFFNKFLKNRFPFVGRDVPMTVTEAEPEVIKEFFRKFQQAGGKAQKILAEALEHQEAVEFLKSMEKVQSFFENFVTQAAETPYYDLIFEFRVNRDHEQGGKNIMYWEAQVDDEKPISKHDGKKTKRWVFGTPLSFKFVWPKDLDKPVQDTENQALQVEDNTAVFRYSTRWSLLWLLRHHQALRGEYDGVKDQESYTLRFDLSMGSGGKTSVYNRVTILQPSANAKTAGKPVRVPDFPVFAPSLQ